MQQKMGKFKAVLMVKLVPACLVRADVAYSPSEDGQLKNYRQDLINITTFFSKKGGKPVLP